MKNNLKFKTALVSRLEGFPGTPEGNRERNRADIGQKENILNENFKNVSTEYYFLHN